MILTGPVCALIEPAPNLLTKPLRTNRPTLKSPSTCVDNLFESAICIFLALLGYSCVRP